MTSRVHRRCFSRNARTPSLLVAGHGLTSIGGAGAFPDRTAFFRYDLWWRANPTAPKNAHGYMLQFVPPLVPVRDAQMQIAELFASDGARVIEPLLAELRQVPISGPLPDDLAYIP